MHLLTESAESLKLLDISANLPGVVSVSRLELLTIIAYAEARFSPSVIEVLLSGSTARGSMLFSLALNSNAWVEVWSVLAGSPLLNGRTIRGEDITEFSANLYSLSSTSSIGLTLFTKMLCLAMGSTLSVWDSENPPGMAFPIHDLIWAIIWSMYALASTLCCVVPQLGHVT